ncbi:hypothetical protein HPB49_016901 [Dermacentor silvarum]|uniref:Uncharacterized protein n=1 Tax=Dermacentor silvarum TaxID=543639 RepID=A0ACB8D6L5_DERSI|nr:hypothetical protein HPB49_016901 [Dermacentor silvarum]
MCFSTQTYVPLVVSASTGSMAASLPLGVSVLEIKCGLDARVVRTVLPMGIVLGRSGSAAQLAVSVLFLTHMSRSTPTSRTGHATPGARPSSANHRQTTMMEVQVEGTTLLEEDYDPADWTKIIGTYQGESQSKARMEDTNGGGLFLPNIQPQLLLRCLCETAKIPIGAEVKLRVHPMNNTCTAATTNQEAALNLVKIRSITLNAKAYGVAAYIVPAADTERGVISNAFWDETEEELLQDLQARNPEAGIVLARRMGKSKSILIAFAQGPILHRIIYYGGVHLCTPYGARPEACTNCRAPGHRYDVCPEPKILRCPRCAKITAKTEHVSAYPDAFCAAESTLQEQDGVKQRSDNKQRSHR